MCGLCQAIPHIFRKEKMEKSQDYVYIAFEGKLSKDYQSAGVTVGYGSPKKSNESVQKHFDRVEEEAFARFAKSMEMVTHIVEKYK